MDLIKKLTGKNPTEYELVAKSMIDNSDVELFRKLVKQDDFLFDFIKENVVKRLQNACNKNNYLNLLSFLDIYSSTYDTMIARVLHSFSGDELLPQMKELFLNGSNSQKAYAVKYFSFVTTERLVEILPLIRQTAESDFEPLQFNSIEILSKLNDTESRDKAIEKLKSDDEFKQFEAIKFLVAYQDKDSLDKIINIMKKSSLSENIASEILYLISIEELLDTNFEAGILVLCNIINAIPEIISLDVVYEHFLYDVFANLPLTSSSAVLFRLAKDKFEELVSNEEYLFDCDKKTKDEVFAINNLLKNYNNHKLESLFYDEIYEESNFVFFALDYVDEIQELEELLDSKNQTLLLKVMTRLKEKQALTREHKILASQNITSEDIKNIVEAL